MQEWKDQREEADEQAGLTRRVIMQAAIGTAVVLTGLSVGYVGVGLLPKAIKTPENAPPQVGDILVYAIGARMNQPIQAAELPEGGPFQLAFPMDPKTGVVRNKQLNNTLLVLKEPPGSYDPKVAASTAGGVVCYSAICTHLGCTVSEWQSKSQIMRCPCHGSVFNPRDDTVVSGPAPLPLAQLPIRLEGSQIVVAGEFSGPVGAQV